MIWLHPSEPGGEPRYAEKPLGDEAKPDSLTLLFSGDGHDTSTAIRQDAEIHFGKANPGTVLTAPESESMPHAWLQVISGGVTLLGESLTTGDGIAIQDAPDEFPITADEGSTFLLFRLS